MEQTWVFLLILIIRKKIHISFWKRSNTRFRTYTNCRKNVFNWFYDDKKIICLSLHYNGGNSYLFVNSKEIVKFKTKDSAIAATRLCLGNISRDWSVNNMKRTGLNGYVLIMRPLFYNKYSIKSIPFLHNYFMAKYKIK